MKNSQLSEKLAAVLQVKDLPENKQVEFLAQISDVIIDSSIMRLITSLEENEVATLQQYIDGATPEDDVFEYLIQTYPTFETIVEEEVLALQTNFAEIMLPDEELVAA